MHKEQLQLIDLTKILVNQKTIFNVEDLHIYSGLSISAIYKLTQSKKLRFSRPNGKVIFFKKEDVDNFLLSKPITTADDIEQQTINYLNAKPLRGGRNEIY